MPRDSLSYPPVGLHVRAGDVLMLGDDLRLALAIAEIALDLAHEVGAPALRVASLQNMINRIRGG